MTRCNYCKMTKTGGNQLFPIGSTTPDYYILGDSVNPTESENNQVFSMATQQGNYLINLLGSVGINISNSAYFKLIRCTYSPQIQADDACRDVCARYAMMDVYKRNPKVIISLGTEVTKYLLGDRFKTISSCRGKLYDIVINSVRFKVLPTYDPNYVINSGSMQVAETFLNDLKYATMYVNGELIDIGEKELAVATTYDEFMNYYNANLRDCTMPAYDIETNAIDPRYNSAKIVGFSLAPSGDTGVYIVRESLEYKMPQSDWDNIVDTMKSYIPSRKVLVHNCMYEIPFTKNEWDVLIGEYEDTLIKSRLLLGGKTGAGLKEQAIRNLGYPDWDKDLGTYLSCLKTMRDKLKPTSGGNPRWDYEVLATSGISALALSYESSTESLDKRSSEVRDAYLRMYRCLESYYYGDELASIMEMIGREVVALIDSNHTGLPSYGSVPMKLIARYGAMDAVATHDLNVFLDSKMIAESEELGIDLYKGYGYWKGHFTVATHMEMSGLYWNDDVANQASKWYSDTCLTSARNMISSGYLDNYLFENNKWRLKEYIIENALDKVMDIVGEFTLMKSCIKLIDGTKITYKNLIPELDARTNGQFTLSMKDVVLQLVLEDVNKATYYTDLKDVFNPGSPKQENKDLINMILVDNEVRLAHFMNELNALIESPDFDIRRYPKPDRDLLQVLIDCREYNSKVDEYNESLDEIDSIDDIESSLEGLDDEFDSEDYTESGDESTRMKVPKVKISSKEAFEKFKIVVNGLISTPLRSNDIQLLLGTSLNYKLLDTKEPTLIELNQYYAIMGIDVEDTSTWTPAYSFLYNFRMWKKCNKMITSYITGKRVGRGAVSIVDKESYSSGDVLTRRSRPYYSDKPFDPETECCVMQSSFKVCAAETGRWQTGLHTIPAGSAIKNVYTSRFKNGIMIMPDYCLTGDTKIKLLDGTSPTIKELADTYGCDKEFWVYAYDESTGKYVPGRARNAHKTREVTELYDIEFDNGEVITCTGNHPLMRRDGSYCTAEDLTPGTSMMALYWDFEGYGGSFNSYESIYHPDGTRQLTHHMVHDAIYGVPSKGYHRHHKDFNKLNNTPENLVSMTKGEHVSTHHKHDESYRDKVTLNLNSYRLDPEKDAQHRLANKNWMSNANSNNEAFINSAVDGKISNILKLTLATHGVISEETYEMTRQGSRSYYKYSTLLNKYGSVDRLIELAENCTTPLESIKLTPPQRSGTRANTSRYKNFLNIVYKKYGFINEGVYELERNGAQNLPKYTTLISKVFPTEDLVEIAKTYNHKVVRVTKRAVQSTPVYDLEVDVYHNFVIDLGDNSGVVSSNSAMEVRVIAGASGCEPMLKVFREGGDIHTQNAALIWNKNPEDITKEERRYSKMGCLVGSTPILQPDGSVKSIQDMYDSGQVDWDVFSFNMSEQQVELGKTYSVQLTDYVSTTVRVTLTGGQVVECTPNHPFMIEDGKYIKAEDLAEGTGIVTMFYKVTDTSVKVARNAKELFKEVVSVEYVTHDSPIPVYDLSVDSYQNYAIDLGDDSAIFVHNTFALLYGADYKGFGDNFLDGDRAKAKQIFDNFFRAFPEIKSWVDKRHEEMRKFGKVTTMSSRYINISPDNFKGDANKALRAAQNYPIQSSGSDMAGYVLYKIHEFIQKNNFKSKCVLFIHDSLEVDIHPDEFLAIGSQVIPLMNQFPMEEWNMVTSADLAVGISLGQECEIKSLETNEDYTEGTMIMEGYDDCLQPLFEAWRNTYSIMEVEDIEEPKEIYVPRGNLWIPKLAVNENFGTHRLERKVRVHVKK